MSVEKYQGFEKWLKENNYVSWKTYLSFTNQIEKTFLTKEFDKITSIAKLTSLLSELQSNRNFASRSKSDRNNILSSFKTYIQFMEEIKLKLNN